MSNIETISKRSHATMGRHIMLMKSHHVLTIQTTKKRMKRYLLAVFSIPGICIWYICYVPIPPKPAGSPAEYPWSTHSQRSVSDRSLRRSFLFANGRMVTCSNNLDLCLAFWLLAFR